MNYYNIKQSIREAAEACGMEPIPTGGSCDYMVLEWEHLYLVLCDDLHGSDVAWNEPCCIVFYDSPFGDCEVGSPQPILTKDFPSPLEALLFIKNFNGTVKL